MPIISRHGQGLEDRDYINLTMKGSSAIIKEGYTAFELESGVSATEEIYEEDEDVPF